MPSSIYKKEVILNATPITAGNDILAEPIDITRDDTKPGGGVLLRVAFSMNYAAANPTISVYNGGVFGGNFVEDTGNLIQSDSAYIWLIVAEEPDTINFRCNRDIDDISIFRVHMLQNP